ncbi:MAG TPA: hypothetical protein VLX92_18075 [Kofleriaceae bacterium]|nr:hypothetical protein [Kofleriaceae bacterium]
MSTDDLFAWDDARRLADEIQVQLHLAGMDARDRWHDLEPRLGKLEQAIARSGGHLGDAVADELHEVRDALRTLRDDVWAHARSSYVNGW